MRFQHSDARAERIIKSITSRFDPEHDPDDGEVEKENDVWDSRVRERDCNYRGATGDGPIRRDIEPLPPDHDPAHLAAIKMRHCIDVTGIVDAALERDGRLLGCGRDAVFGCHD